MRLPFFLRPLLPILAALASSTALAACADVAADQDASGAAIISNKPALCTLPSRALTKPNADYYRTFESYDALVDFAGPFLAAVGRPPPVRTRDARHERAAQLLEPVYRAFEKLYPAHVAGMPGPPAVVIVESKEPNAFAAFDDRPGMEMKGPWAFFVHSSLFESADVTDEGLRGLFAHELGHLILKNTIPDVQESMKRTYAIGPNGEAGVLGLMQTDDPALHARVDRFEKLCAATGKLTLPEMNGVPYAFGVTAPQYKAILANLFDSHAAASPHPEACAAAGKAGAELRAIVERHFSFHDWRVDLGTDAKALDQATRTFVTQAEVCFDHVRATLLDLKIAFFASQLPTEEARQDLLAKVKADPAGARADVLDDEERAYDDAHHGETAGKLLLGLSRSRLAMLADLQRAAPEWSAIRQYGFEEEADDVASRISRSLGDDPRAVGNFTLSFVPKEYRDACLATVKARKAPSYGALVDTHPATCWRYYHLDELSKVLTEKCGGS